jgi:peroxiredoxin
LDSLDKTVTSKLQSQNLSLWLALASDAGTALVADSKEVAKVADNNIDSIAYPSILISQEDADLTIIIDPKTHLIRREIIDIAKRAKTLGAQDIKSSTYTADFVNTSVDSVDDSTFAWAPPPGSQMIQSQGAEGDASALEGKAAPAFELSKHDGQKVSSKDLKGTVYILDFWATWCGPCVASMPALNETYEKYKDKGLHVFACDQAEDKATVAKFAESNKLTLTVLLDSDSKVGQSYGANAIPETVLIGKDGKVRKVFVGYGDGQEDNIRKAIDEAMAQN